MKYRIPAALALVLFAAPAFAQSLADLAAKTAAQRQAVATPSQKVLSDRDLQPDALTAAAKADEAAAIETPDNPIDRSKFERVYQAGKAVDGAKFLSAVGVAPWQFQQLLLAFETEISVLTDKVSTKAERALAAKYQVAMLKYRLGLSEYQTDGAHHFGTDTMADAGAGLDKANAIYLSKPVGGR